MRKLETMFLHLLEVLAFILIVGVLPFSGKAEASSPPYGRITRFYVGGEDRFRYMVERTEFPADSTVCYRPVETGGGGTLACTYNPAAFRR